MFRNSGSVRRIMHKKSGMGFPSNTKKITQTVLNSSIKSFLIWFSNANNDVLIVNFCRSTHQIPAKAFFPIRTTWQNHVNIVTFLP